MCMVVVHKSWHAFLEIFFYRKIKQKSMDIAFLIVRSVYVMYRETRWDILLQSITLLLLQKCQFGFYIKKRRRKVKLCSFLV